jgi:hypothetical protein
MESPMEQALRLQVTNLQKILHNLTYNYKLLQEQQQHLIKRLNTDEEIRDKKFRDVNINVLASKYAQEFVELKSKTGGRTKRRRRRRRKKTKKRRK